MPLVSEYQGAGRLIAFAQPGLTGLTLCDLATQKCEPLPVAIGDANRFDWLLTGDAVWYREAAAPDTIVRYDLARRADVFLTSFLPQHRAKFGIDVDDIDWPPLVRTRTVLP